MTISINHITKQFGSYVALNDVSLKLADGELTALLGPSGSGKTTLLRIIAGLEQPDSGTLQFFGQESTNRPPRERQVGFVFQHYALFRHMSIFDNVAFGLRIRPRATRPHKDEIHEKVMKLLKMVQLDALAKRYPSELSGGQKQRVALARALAVEPRVLLLDEPFGALDAKVRQELRRWLRYLHDATRLTSVFVTHDQDEALEVADRIVVLNKGRIEQVGTPEEVYDNPANPFVYEFMGNVNLYHGRVEHEASLFIRPHDIELSRSNTNGKAIAARILSYKTLGSRVRVGLQALNNKETIEANIEKKAWRELNVGVDDDIYFSILSGKVYAADETWSDYVI